MNPSIRSSTPSNYDPETASLETDFSEKPSSWVSPTPAPGSLDRSITGLSCPRPTRNMNELRSLAVSRSRFVLRLCSLIFSLAGVGMLANSYVSFGETAGSGLIYAGEELWPDRVDFTGSNVILGTHATTAFFSLCILIAGLWPKIRHTTNIGDFVALVVGVVNLALAIFGGVFFWMYKKQGVSSLRSWTCNHKTFDHPQVQFASVCAELRFSQALAFAIIAAESLTLINILVGFFIVQKKPLERVNSHSRKPSQTRTGVAF